MLPAPENVCAGQLMHDALVCTRDTQHAFRAIRPSVAFVARTVRQQSALYTRITRSSLDAAVYLPAAVAGGRSLGYLYIPGPHATTGRQPCPCTPAQERHTQSSLTDKHSFSPTWGAEGMRDCGKQRERDRDKDGERERDESCSFARKRGLFLFVPHLSLSPFIPLPPHFHRTTHLITQAHRAPSGRGNVNGAGGARSVPAGRGSVAGDGGAREVACHLLVCACPPAPGEQSDKQVVISSGSRPGS